MPVRAYVVSYIPKFKEMLLSFVDVATKFWSQYSRNGSHRNLVTVNSHAQVDQSVMQRQTLYTGAPKRLSRP